MRMSDSVGELAKALGVFQENVPHVVLNKGGHHGKYADLPSIVSTIRPTLVANGLSVSQPTEFDESGSPIIETILMHSSGEWIAGSLKMVPAKANAQGVGGAITYARRYGLCALLGIVASDDDDGDSATNATRPSVPITDDDPPQAYVAHGQTEIPPDTSDLEKLYLNEVQIASGQSALNAVQKKVAMDPSLPTGVKAVINRGIGSRRNVLKGAA